MNKVLYLIAPVLILLCSCQKTEYIEPTYYQCAFGDSDSSHTHVNHFKYQSLIEEMISNGVVGATMSVFDGTNTPWNGAAGKADLYHDIDMKACNIFRVGSTVKTITAATVLMLSEEEKVNLDDKISDYLEGDMINRIKNADVATIRELIQHSAGLYNYIQNVEFQTASLNDLVRAWHAQDLLAYAYDKEAYFSPGTDVRYSNTGYILLGLLIEKIEGKPFYEVFEERIFTPLGLTMTRFAAKDPVPDGIVRGYIDLYSNLQVLESAYFNGWDYFTADGGLISNPYDLNLFMKALLNGHLISSSALEEMLSWQVPREVDTSFYPMSFGLGLFKIETPYGEAYLHSGDAIGYYANMIYFPERDIAIAYAVNSNYGKIDEHVSSKTAMDKIFATILE